ITREPRTSDSATFSAACRHTVQAMNNGSPSFHSLVLRSMKRGVDATRNLATAAPDGVKRSSGSSVRLPTIVILVSPAAIGQLLAHWSLWGNTLPQGCDRNVPGANRTRPDPLSGPRGG